MIRRLRWPPPGLGLGTPLNLALLSDKARAGFGRTLWLSTLLGLSTATAILALDQALFEGVSLERIRAVGAVSLAVRGGIILYSSVAEEAFFRLGVATLVAWLARLALTAFWRHNPGPKSLPEWVGVFAAAIWFGLAHVGNLPDVEHPVLRALTLNGFAGVAFGWWYWVRGLEAAIVAHLAANALVYLVVATLLQA